MDLKDAKVLVTGGTAGIGLEIARLLESLGAKVAVCGRDAGRIEAAKKVLQGPVLQADISVEADVKRVVETVIAELGGYNVLVNNAAWGYFAPLLEQETARFEALMATNLTGAMLAARESAKHFVQQQSGNIINIGSTSGSRGHAGGTAYCASKFALRGLTEVWRAELRKHNIRVSLVAPSEVLTGFAEAAGYSQKESPRKLRSEEIAHTVASMLQLDDRGFIPFFEVWATNPD